MDNGQGTGWVLREISNIHAKKGKLLRLSHRVRQTGPEPRALFLSACMRLPAVYGGPESTGKALSVNVCFSKAGTRTVMFTTLSNEFNRLRLNRLRLSGGGADCLMNLLICRNEDASSI